METRYLNTTKISAKDMYNGFLLKKKWYSVTYQIFTFVFLLSIILGLTYSTADDRMLNVSLSTIFFLISVSIGFLYPIYRSLNWKNTLVKQSGKSTVKVQYIFNENSLRATSSVKDYDFKLNYDEIEKIRETKKYYVLILAEGRFVLISKEGFKSTKEFERVNALIRKKAKI